MTRSLRSFIASRVLDLRVEAWTWPFAEARRAEIDGAFRRQAARKARDVERPRPARAQPGVCRRPLQRQLFRNRFRKLSGLARLGFSRTGVFNGFGMGALRCADGAFVLGEMGQHTRTPGASIFRRARPTSTTSADGTVDIAGSVTREARGGDRALTRPNTGAEAALGTVSYSGPARRDDQGVCSRHAGEALRARIEANLAGSISRNYPRIHLVRGAQRYSRPAMPRFVPPSLRGSPFASPYCLRGASGFPRPPAWCRRKQHA